MRVVITAAGGISSYGTTTEELAQSFKGKYNDFETDFDAQTAPVTCFNLKDYIGRYKNRRYLNRGSKLAVAGALSTVQNSGIKLSETCGLFVGAGPNVDIPNSGMNYDEQSALWLLKHLPNTAASSISALLDIHGENSTISTACSASLQAIGEGFRRIKNGYTDMVLAGGGDSRLSEGGIKGYQMAGALYKGDNASENYSPLRSEPMGFIPGEGSAFFILESLESALENGRDILAEITGFGLSMDAFNMTTPEPYGINQEKAILSALNESSITCEDIGVISAHGTGTPLNDAMEKKLIKRLFHNRPHVAAFKEWFGHLSAACGAVELWSLLSCYKSDSFPQIHRSKASPEYGGNVIKSDYALLENFGFGGQNAALVVKRWN